MAISLYFLVTVLVKVSVTLSNLGKYTPLCCLAALCTY